jgi:hypothetical protein
LVRCGTDAIEGADIRLSSIAGKAAINSKGFASAPGRFNRDFEAEPRDGAHYMRAAIFVLCLTMVSPAYCATPSALLNKSIQVSVAVSVTAKDPSGQVRHPTGAIKQTIYISSLGRVFVRQTITSYFASISSDLPVVSSAAVAGRRMLVVVPLIRGRASAIINFDSQYGTCTAQGAVGSASITFKGSDGVIYETISPVTFGSSNCSVRSGNALNQ